jgi:hypothetical protein
MNAGKIRMMHRMRFCSCGWRPAHWATLGGMAGMRVEAP